MFNLTKNPFGTGNGEYYSFLDKSFFNVELINNLSKFSTPAIYIDINNQHTTKVETIMNAKKSSTINHFMKKRGIDNVTTDKTLRYEILMNFFTSNSIILFNKIC